MSGIFGKVKDLVWGAMNAPNTEIVDEYDDDYELDVREERVDRDEQWEMPYARETRGQEKRTRQAQNSKVLEMYGKEGIKSEIMLRHPMDVSDAAKVCDYIAMKKYAL